MLRLKVLVPILVGITTALTLGAAQASETESDRLNAFFERVHQDAVKRWPEWQTSLGLKGDNDKWNEWSEARSVAEHELTIRNLARLRTRFDYDKLGEVAKLSYRLFERGAERSVEWFPFRHYGYPVNHLSGVHKGIPTFLINKHEVDELKDAQAYIARIEGIAGLMDQIIASLEIRTDKGIIPPRFVFRPVREAIAEVLTGAPFDASGHDTAILKDFRKKVGKLGLSRADSAQLIDAASNALLHSMKPAYAKLGKFMDTLEPRATDDAGAWKHPDGEVYYALALRSTTTTDLTATEIHDFGLQEVDRIHGEMRSVISTMGFEGTLKDYFAFVRTDPDNFYPNTDAGRAAYLDDTKALIDEMRGRLDDYFVAKPKAGLVVKRVETYREKTTGIAFYQRPAIYSDRPGMYYVNLYDMTLMPRSHLEALAYHEAIPGHHMQIALTQEIEGLPKFRTLGGNTAYIEGWGLYAERLAKEMGFYREPISDFGRLAWELLRAARLVVDTGIHFKRWTREQAIAYLDENLPVKHATNRQAIERYIVWPSQATAYKIGMRKILALRSRAKTRLGDRFDIREFHETVLGNGTLPLNILDEVVEQWIADREAAN